MIQVYGRSVAGWKMQKKKEIKGVYEKVSTKIQKLIKL